MTKIIGVKELQTKTKKIREEVGKGIHFIVVWRSKPIFEIQPLNKGEFAYTDDFIERMEQAQEDIRSGRTKKFKSTEEFLKSLS